MYEKEYTKKLIKDKKILNDLFIEFKSQESNPFLNTKKFSKEDLKQPDNFKENIIYDPFNDDESFHELENENSISRALDKQIFFEEHEYSENQDLQIAALTNFPEAEPLTKVDVEDEFSEEDIKKLITKYFEEEDEEEETDIEKNNVGEIANENLKLLTEENTKNALNTEYFEEIDELEDSETKYENLYIDIFRNVKMPYSKMDISSWKMLGLYIHVKNNNIFVNVRDINNNEELSRESGGQSDLHVSKKSLKTTVPQFLEKYFHKNFDTRSDECEIYGIFDAIVIKLVAPAILRKNIMKVISDNFLSNLNSSIQAPVHIFNIPYKKCFNGTRGRKQLRKKNKGDLILK